MAPQAVYVHCYAHCLNLVLVNATKKVTDSADFAIMESLYVFLSTLFIVNSRLQCIQGNLHVNFNTYQILDGHVGTLQLMPYVAHMMLFYQV